MIKNAHANILCVKGKGPREAMRDLATILTNDKARADWKEAARLAAIVGSCPKSMREASSGMRAWICFARDVLGVKGSLWPPKEHDIMAWSNMFRAEATFSKYLGHVKTGCMLVNAPIDILEGPVVKRAKLAIAKRAVRTKGKTVCSAASVGQSDVVCAKAAQCGHGDALPGVMRIYVEGPV